MDDQPFFCMRQWDIDVAGDKPLVRALLALDAVLNDSGVNADDAAAVKTLVREAGGANADLRYCSNVDIDYGALFQLLYEANTGFSRRASVLELFLDARRRRFAT